MTTVTIGKLERYEGEDDDDLTKTRRRRFDEDDLTPKTEMKNETKIKVN
jgi:hypothetical protein